jgi:hypothetical protein
MGAMVGCIARHFQSGGVILPVLYFFLMTVDLRWFLNLIRLLFNLVIDLTLLGD